MKVRADLYPYEEIGNSILCVTIVRVTGGSIGFMQADEREVNGIQKIGSRIAVLLDESALTGAVLRV